MGLAVSLIGSNTARDHGLRDVLPRVLRSLAKHGAATALEFELGLVTVPAGYADSFTEGLGSYSDFGRFRAWVGRQPNATKRFPHILEHSDTDGFYLPIPFTVPLQRISRSGVFGALIPQRVSVGSSVQLLQELDQLKSALGMPGDAGEITEAALDDLCDADPTLPRSVWAVLRWFARESSRQRVAIVMV